MMNTWIVNIGNELLNGHTVNTNAAYLSEQLHKLGFDVSKIVCIKDKPEDITNILNEATHQCSLIIISGGLGPTLDDLTRKSLSEFFHRPLIFHEDLWNEIQQKFSFRKMKAPEINKVQAYMPQSAMIFKNTIGTAAGFAIIDKQCCTISLPGVPFELKHIFEQEVKPFLRAYFKQLNPLQVNTLLFSLITESELAEKLSAFEEELSKHNVKTAFLPQPGLIKVKFYQQHNSEEVELVNKIKQFAKTYLSDFLIFDEDVSLPEILHNMMITKNDSLCTAESCTGGYLANQIISTPGSSKYFKGSIIAYSNEIKQNILQVPAELIKQHGAVSRQVVECMARNALNILNADIAIATSGIAGPDGATESKPVGTTWIAIARKKYMWAEQFIFGNDRFSNIQRTSNTALAKLILLLNNKAL